MEIRNVYWFVHPAYPLRLRSTEGGYTAANIRDFIRTHIHPVIERAAKAEDSLVILVKSPRFSQVGRGESDARFRLRASVEKSLENHLKSRVPSGRIIVAQGEHLMMGSEIAKLVRDAGMVIHPDALVHSFGGWREQCAVDYPAGFKTVTGLTHTAILSPTGTISGIGADKRAKLRRQKP